MAVALEASTRPGSVAVRVGQDRGEVELAGERSHASDLLPLVERLLVERGARPAEIELVAVGTGPGSFTGIRVALATAFGIARGARAALFGVSSFDALAWRELAPGETASVLWNARAGRLYHARLTRTEDDVRAEIPAEAIAVSEARGRLADAGALFTDDTLARVLPLDAEQRARERVGARPGAAAVLSLALRRFARTGAMAPETVQPLYLQPFGSRPDPAGERPRQRENRPGA